MKNIFAAGSEPWVVGTCTVQTSECFFVKADFFNICFQDRKKNVRDRQDLIREKLNNSHFRNRQRERFVVHITKSRCILIRTLFQRQSMMTNLKTFILAILSTMLCWPVVSQRYWRMIEGYPQGLKTCLGGLNDSILLTGTAKGIYRSGDTGKYWDHALLSSPIYSIHASASGKVIAGGEGKVFYSIDTGITWDSLSLNTGSIVHQFAETTTGEFFLITGILNDLGFEGNGVFFSDGDLSQWEKRNEGLPFASVYCESIAIDGMDRVYLGVADTYVTGAAGLFMSDDKGLHWQHIPLTVDGLGTLRVENPSSITITPQDSVIISCEGVVTNFGYSLNIIKHRDDVTNSDYWRPLRVWNTNMWWNDQLLNTIYYSVTGEWYSSIKGGSTQGGTWTSHNNGYRWARLDKGMPFAATGKYEKQFFHETSSGSIFMVQSIDDRIYILEGIDRPYYTISGNIKDTAERSLKEVVVYGLGDAVFTDDDGRFILDVPEGSTGPLTFVKNGYEFSPSRIDITNLSRDTTDIQIQVTYTGFYTISGSVQTMNGTPLQHIYIAGLPDSVSTDTLGNFQCLVKAGWSGTITPLSDIYQFQPAQWNIDQLHEDNLYQSFNAFPITHTYNKETFHADVFPNPSFDGTFNLSVKNSKSSILSIWTINGIKLHETHLRRDHKPIEIWQAPGPGVYMVRIQSDEICLHHRIVSYSN